MLVAFAGCDGAGKSTQVKLVHEWLVENGWEAEIVDRWHILDAAKFPECRFIRSTRRDLPVCIGEMEGLARAMFLLWSVSLTIQGTAPRDASRIYLLDGYWMKIAAAEIEFGCDRAWLEATVRCLPEADVTFCLDIEPQEALRRKSDLTPYECGRNPELNPEDFIRHQTKMRRRLLDWADEFGWSVMSALQKPEVLTEHIGADLGRRLEAMKADRRPWPASVEPAH